MDRVLRSRCPVTVKGEPQGREAAGRHPRVRPPQIEIECLPADIPEHIEVNVSELMLHQGIRVRDVATERRSGSPSTTREMMLVHVIMPKAEEAPAPAEAGSGCGDDRRHRPSPKSSRRARRTRTKRRTTRRSSGRERPDESDRWARESRGRSIAARGTTSASRWSTSWRSGPAVEFESAPVEALIARVARRAETGRRRVLLVKPLTFMNASGEAVGGLLRYFKIDPADLLVVVDEAQLPLGEAAGPGAGIGRRAQRAEVGHRARRRRSFRGCGSGWDGAGSAPAAGHGGIWPITCCHGSSPDERAEVDRMIARAADAAEMFITAGIAAGDEPVQRRRSGNN